MNRLLCVVSMMVLLASVAQAQEPPPRPPLEVDLASTQNRLAQTQSMANITPEMWLYMQEMERYDDPEMAVRRKAEQRAAQRQNRIAARKWFGLSNIRPVANPVPIMSSYSPYWAGQNSDPHRWDGIGGPVIQIFGESGGELR